VGEGRGSQAPPELDTKNVGKLHRGILGKETLSSRESGLETLQEGLPTRSKASVENSTKDVGQDRKVKGNT